MRIEYLHMRNFAPFFVALDKTDIELDYRPVKDKVINILIGQMGSCKTFLLGHHQPFAKLGNLDVRNAEDMVLPGKKGLKEVIYSKGDDLFEIQHVYTPTPSGKHTIKSYIKKNGEELNENGNESSFVQIIDTEFGLDQNFLKLFRIGSNVTNLPDMTSTERKAFISSMLSDTDIFTYLYKKIGEENRAINAQMTILVNKLHAISTHSEEELQSDCDAEAEISREISEEVEELNRRAYSLEGAMATLRGSLSNDEYRDSYRALKEQLETMETRLEKKREELEALNRYGDINERSQRIAALMAQISVRSQQILQLGSQIEADGIQRDQLRDQLAMIGSSDQIDQLKHTYEDLMKTLENYKRQLRGFEYEGSMGSITSLMSELQTLNGLITDLSKYDVDVLKEIIRNPGKSMRSAETQLGYLRSQQDKVTREMNNIKQGVMWQPTHLMVRPFNCPTKDCPYYKYHPLTEQKANAGKNVDALFLERQNQLREIESKIYRFEEVPNIVRSVQTVQRIWNSIVPKAEELGVIRESSLTEVVTNLMHRQWYDPEKLQHIRELCGIREKYYELMQTVASMRNDLAQYELGDVPTLQSNLEQLTERYRSEQKQLETLEAENTEDRNELESINELMLQLSSLDVVKAEVDSLEEQCKGVRSEIAQIERNLAQITSYMSEFDGLKITIAQKTAEFKVHADAHERLQRTIAEVRFNKEQYEETLQKQQLVKDILDAVSSKKGIPLAFVKLFLSDCTGILNDLIADVFDDAIEILDFEIPDDGSEFTIPYSRNGVFIGDIVKSSQGERAIISLALSFALIRQGHFPYNIMLLDEVDGPLYKTAREKFITILFKQMKAINAEQVFIVSHNNTFDGFNVNIIMTTDEIVDESPMTSVMKL